MLLYHFPEKNVCALSFFEDLTISLSNASSQNDIQTSLDDLLFKQLLNSSTIYDQARMHAVLPAPGQRWLA